MAKVFVVVLFLAALLLFAAGTVLFLVRSHTERREKKTGEMPDEDRARRLNYAALGCYAGGALLTFVLTKIT